MRPTTSPWREGARRRTPTSEIVEHRQVEDFQSAGAPSASRPQPAQRRQFSHHHFPNRSQFFGKAFLGQAQRDDGSKAGPGPFRNPAGEPGPNAAEHQTIESGDEALNPKGEAGEEPDRQIRIGRECRPDRLAGDEETPSRLGRGGRGGIRAAGEERHLAQRAAGPLLVNHLPAANRLANDPDPAFDHDEEPLGLVAGAEQHLAPGIAFVEAAARKSVEQPTRPGLHGRAGDAWQYCPPLHRSGT